MPVHLNYIIILIVNAFVRTYFWMHLYLTKGERGGVHEVLKKKTTVVVEVIYYS